jgi:hypothetical protein
MEWERMGRKMKKRMILLLVLGLAVPVQAKFVSFEQTKKDEIEAARAVKIRRKAMCCIVYGILGLIFRNYLTSTYDRINYGTMFLVSLYLS